MNRVESNRVLECLSDGLEHSVDELAQILQVYSTEITQWCESLHAAGYLLELGDGKVRWCEPFPVFSEEALRKGLPPNVQERLGSLQVFPFLDSTNDEIRRGEPLGDRLKVVLAGLQSRGRGQRGRVWSSPPGGGVYLSLGWLRPAGMGYPEGLSLAVGVAVVEVLRALGCDRCGVKWPNDLYVGRAKLGGVLVELFHRPGGEVEVVIGLGLNLVGAEHGAVVSAWTTLEAAGGEVSRGVLVLSLIEVLAHIAAESDVERKQGIAARWDGMDLALGAPVVVEGAGECQQGRGAGLTDRGDYRVVTELGDVVVDGVKSRMRLL